MHITQRYLAAKRYRLMITFLTIALVLQAIGLLFVYSASSVYALETYGDALFFFKKQLFYLMGAWGCCAVVLMVPFNWLFEYALVWWMLACGVTAGTLFWAKPINGACRWFSFAGVSVQPSEFLTVATLLYAATFLERHISEHKPFLTRSIIPFLVLLSITSGILLKQPDFGSTVTLLVTVLALVFVVGISCKESLFIGSILLPLFVGLICARGYRLARFMTFLDPWSDPQGKGFQIIQSLFAIGSGKLFGVGIGMSRQKFFYLPMQHTDFIFSIIAEEVGFLGTCTILVLYGALAWYGFLLVQYVERPEAILCIVGALFFMSIKTILNCLVCVGLVPTKGLALPFMSYGGSALVAQWLLIGIIINAFLAKNESF